MAQVNGQAYAIGSGACEIDGWAKHVMHVTGEINVMVFFSKFTLVLKFEGRVIFIIQLLTTIICNIC